MTRLSKRIVDATQPNPDVRVFVWDGVVKGFGLAVMPTGAKSYVFQYRADGQSRRIKLGTHGSITAEQARQLALDMAERVRRGEDPLRNKQAARNALTVGEMLDRYVESEAFKAKAPATQYNDLGRIRRHLRPLLGRNVADTLTARDTERAMRAIREGKTAIREKTKPRGLARVRGGNAAAIDSIGLLRAVYNWAIKAKLVTSNPTTGVKLGSHGIRDTILETGDDYRRMFEAIDKLETEHRIRTAAAAAIKVLALTGCRKSEIAGLRWRNIDMKLGQIVLHEHKTAKRTGKRIIALPSLAQQIISEQPSGDPDAFVFAPAHGSRPIQLTRPWQVVRTEAQLPEGIGLHGLRHSIASLAAVGGATGPELATLLGHARPSQVTARYLHWADSGRAALAERAASPIAAALREAEGSPRATIHNIKRGR